MNVQLAQAKALLSKAQPNPDKAIKTLKPLLKKRGGHWLVHHYLGIAHLQKKQFAKAKASLEEAFRRGSDQAETYHLMSLAHFNLEEYKDAIFYAKEAISRNDQYLEAWVNLGAAYRAIADLDNAMKAYSKANQLDPKNAEIAYRIGSIYFDQGHLSKAEELYTITKQMNPKFLEAYLGLALVYSRFQKFDKAEKEIRQALEIDPKNRFVRIQLAVLFKESGRYAEAIELNRELLIEKPNDGRLRINYALCLLEIGKFNEAESNYLRALRDTPEVSESLSNYLMGIHYNPERTKEEIFEAHLLWDKYFAPKVRLARPVPKNLDPEKKLRIGLISGGFRIHPVGWMITRAIEHLPKDQFEIYIYSMHPFHDALTTRLHKVSDKWRSLLGYNDEVTANLIREDEIDILVELAGHSAHNRLKTVALEPAPITVKWVGGLINTTGMKSMDYLITDFYESPEGEEEFYTEKLVRLPHDYVCYDPPKYDIPVGELPAKHNGFITFGCFNNPTKLNQVLLKEWAEILKAVPKSKLFLKSKQYDTPSFVQGVVDQMAAFGIGEERLIFEGYAMHEDFLATYNRVDIALDTWPYSGGLTTCEALWMGVPVITHAGPTFAGKHSTTHLTNTGYAQWVTDNWEEYKQLAIKMATHLPELEKTRANLRQQLLTSPLCDGPRFGAHLAQAFRTMWHQRVEGYKRELPEGEWQQHITVQPISEEDLQQFKTLHKFCSGEPVVKQHSLYKTEQGITFSFPIDESNLTRFVFEEQGKWLDPEVDVLCRITPKDSIVFDVGAGFGAYTLPLAQKVGTNRGRVVAFEPHSTMAAHLKESKRQNCFSQLEVVERAAWNKTGAYGFRHKSIMENSLLSQEQALKNVQTTTLDDVWNEYGQPSVEVLKIDVNGAEFEVVQGASKMVETCHPLMLISDAEHIPHKAEIHHFLKQKGYSLFELIPELGILSGYNGDANSFRQNLFALTAEHQEKCKKAGLLFGVDESEPEIVSGGGMSYLSRLSWTSTFKNKWIQKPESQGEILYFKALDAIGTAFGLDKSQAVQQAQLLLEAATSLMPLFNANPQSIPVSFTLVRVLHLLGKRADAAAILKQQMQRLLSGESAGDLSLPFFLPLKLQEESEIFTAAESWLKIKAAEAWLLLQTQTSYYFSNSDVKLLQGLSGNPEAVAHINHLAKNMLKKGAVSIPADPIPNKEGKFVHVVNNHVYAKSLADLLKHLNTISEQQHYLLVEKHSAIATYHADIEDYDKVQFFNSKEDMEWVTRQCMAEDVDAVFMHGIFYEYQKKLAKSIGTSKHIGWIMWGGDLYNPIKFNVPARFLSGFIDSIHTPIPGDIDLFKRYYGNRLSYAFGYPYAGLYGTELKSPPKTDPPTIIVGNSGDSANNHIEILEMLATKKDIDDFRLFLPVSYNLAENYEQQLMAAIKQFGLEELTHLQREFIDPAKYMEVIGSASMFITAHNRQQAVGNILGALYFGNPTFVKKQITVQGKRLVNPNWEFLTSRGFEVHNYEELANASHLKDFQPVSANQLKKHQQIIMDEFGLEQRARQLEASCRDILQKVRNKASAQL